MQDFVFNFVKTKTTVEILQGVEIKAKNPDELRRMVDRFRDMADIIIVAGGELDINRAACENPKVDILSTPEKQRRDSGIDHVMAKLAAENKVAIDNKNFNTGRLILRGLWSVCYSCVHWSYGVDRLSLIRVAAIPKSRTSFINADSDSTSAH